MPQRDRLKANVLAFPLDRSVEVARMARFLHVVHGERADAYYTRRCRELVRQMLAAGLIHEEVQRQILAFQDAVQMRLQAGLDRSAEEHPCTRSKLARRTRRKTAPMRANGGALCDEIPF